MIIKTEVTPEESAVIKQNAKAEGKTITAYLRDRALGKSEHTIDALMQSVEVLSGVGRDINVLATTVIKNKVIYEEEILELLERMTVLEANAASVLKEVRKHGNIGK